MMKIMRKCAVLAGLLCLLFVLPAQAEPTYAGTTVQVDSFEGLLALVGPINTEGAAAYVPQQEKYMECVNIEVTENIEITSSVNFKRGTNVHIYGAPGKTITISAGPAPTDLFNYYLNNNMFKIEGAAKFQLSNVTVDGQRNCRGFLEMQGAKITLGGAEETDAVTIQNFNTDTDGPFVIKGVNSNANPVGTAEGGHYVSPDLTLNHVTYRNIKTGVSGNVAFQIASTANNTVTIPFAKLTIKNSLFENNAGYNAGVIRAVRANVSIENSVFKNNTAKQYLINNVLTGDGGGALHLQNGTTATISNTKFEGNKSELSGGAVTAFVDTSITFTNCTFTGNEAATHGGAICVADNFDSQNNKPSTIELVGCTLEKNKANGEDFSNTSVSSPEAPGGGAIFLHEFCSATLGEGTKLVANESADEGGAVYVSFGAELICEGAELLQNTAATNGGAVFVDGTNAYAGYSHANDGSVPGDDLAKGQGGEFYLIDGLLQYNTAGENGGAVYIAGQNTVDGVTFEEPRGGLMVMSGGVITENTAMDMGGGVYVGDSGNESAGGTFTMTGGSVCVNIAGENGNTSDGLSDAGAEIYCEGTQARITVVEAVNLIAYMRDTSNTFVPQSHRSLYFEDWYDDYSDQDEEYGKDPYKTTGHLNTGRYTSSDDPGRVVYTPKSGDTDRNALILGYRRPNNGAEPVAPAETPDLPQTGDETALSLYALLMACSAAAYMLLRRRLAK